MNDASTRKQKRWLGLNAPKFGASGNVRFGRRRRRRRGRGGRKMSRKGTARALARGPSTSRHAFERYRVLRGPFDEAAKPASLTFEDIHRLTLCSPFTFGPEDIDWAAFETIFPTARAAPCAHKTTASLLRSRTGGSIVIDGARVDYSPR
jgi:hypothetical protein